MFAIKYTLVGSVTAVHFNPSHCSHNLKSYLCLGIRKLVEKIVKPTTIRLLHLQTEGKERS
jgi:hypothetical protein